MKTFLILLIFLNNFQLISASTPSKIAQDILEVKQTINDKSEILKKYNQTISSLNQEINSQYKKISDIKKSIDFISSKQKDLNNELNELEINLRNNQDVIKKFMVVMHKHSNYPKLKILLSKDIFNWSLLLNYLKYLNNYEKQKFDVVIKQIEKITALYNVIEKNKKELTKEQNTLESESIKLVKLQEQEVLFRDNAKQELEKNKEKLAELLDEISRKNIKKTKRTISSNDNFKELKSQLIMPIQGKVIKFNEDSNEEKLTQNGVFIKNSSDHKDIHSVYDGKVVFADWLKLYGNVVIVDHLNGYMSLYANNEKITTKVGSYIQAGERIAVIGNSGEFGQHGSYFELRHQGKPLSPIKWLKIG